MQMKKEYRCPAIRSIAIRPRHTLLAGSPVSPSRSLDVDNASVPDYTNGGEQTWQDN